MMTLLAHIGFGLSGIWRRVGEPVIAQGLSLAVSEGRPADGIWRSLAGDEGKPVMARWLAWPWLKAGPLGGRSFERIARFW